MAQITERGYPVAEVSERLGVSQHSLYSWKRQLAKVMSDDSSKDAEIRQLKRELARVSPDSILADLLAENRARCDPPLDESEVEKAAASVLRYDPSSQHAETELGNARRLVDLMDGNARYEPASRSWYCWDGRYWWRDDDGPHAWLSAWSTVGWTKRD